MFYVNGLNKNIKCPNLPRFTECFIYHHNTQCRMETRCEIELERAVNIAAGLVENLGDDYWPIFECLEAELIKRRSRFQRLRKFKKMRESGQSGFD